MYAFAMYCAAEWRAEQEEKAYRIYVTDTLKCIAENTAKFGGGNYIKTRFYDVINIEPEKESTEIRTPEEVIDYMLDKINRW